MSINRYEPYPGDDLATRLPSRCNAAEWNGASCDRIEGHPGEHVEVSGLGLVLAVWGSEDADGGIDAKTREVIETLADIREQLASAISDAEWRLRELRQKHKDDEVLVELIDKSDVPSEYVEIGLTDDEAEWPAEIEAIRNRLSKRKVRAA